MIAAASAIGAGSLREWIGIELKTVTRDDLGGEVIAWTPAAETWAAIDAIGGRETAIASQLKSVVSLSVTIRTGLDVEVDATSRIRWCGRILSVEAVLPSPRRDRLTFLCSEGLNQADL